MIDNIILFLLRLGSTPIFAQGLISPDEPPTVEDFLLRVEGLITYILPIGALLAVAMIVYGGYLWMASGGQPDKKQKAQGTLTWSVVGLAFLFLIRMLLSWLLELVTS